MAGLTPSFTSVTSLPNYLPLRPPHPPSHPPPLPVLFLSLVLRIFTRLPPSCLSVRCHQMALPPRARICTLAHAVSQRLGQGLRNNFPTQECFPHSRALAGPYSWASASVSLVTELGPWEISHRVSPLQAESLMNGLSPQKRPAWVQVSPAPLPFHDIILLLKKLKTF